VDSEITIKMVTTAEEIESVKPLWKRLNQHPESDPDFVAMLASVRPEIASLFLLIAYREGEPVSMMIGRIEDSATHFRFGYWKALRIRTRRMVFVRDGFLGERSPEIAAKMMEAISQTLKMGVADYAILHSFPRPLLEQCPAHPSSSLSYRAAGGVIQHWKTTLPDNFEAFLCKRSAKHRYNLLRTVRKFEAEFAGRLRYAIFDAPADAEAFCKAAEVVAQQTYQRGVGAGFVDNEENRKRVLLMAQKSAFRAYVAFVDDQPVAFWYGEQSGDVVYIIWTAFDRAYGKYEVGTILFLKMVEDFMARDIQKIDYGPGWALYKERFGDGCLQEHDLAIYSPTLKGRSLGFLQKMETAINQSGKQVLARLQLRERVKKLWRIGLANKAATHKG